jgi:DNA polymerase
MESGKSQAPDFSVKKSLTPMTDPVTEPQDMTNFPSENCQNCSMSKAGRKAVPVLGNQNSDLWVITDPPSLEAERLGLPLGPDEMDYFQKWMAAIDMNLPEDLCLMNLTRCRPPGSRPPFPEEITRCAKDLESRLNRRRPRVLFSMGPSCSAWFTGQKGMKVSEMRGRLYDWYGVPLVVTYSPIQVLNFGELKRPVWEDLKSLRNILNGS